MNWIRNNKFLASVAGAMVVLVAVAVFLGLGYDDEIATAMKSREKVIGKIRSLHKSPHENTATIREKKRASESLAKALRDVTQGDIDWNRQNYRMLDLPLPADSGGGVRAAFPFSKEEWTRSDLYYHFVSTYHKKLQEMLTMLRPVTLDPEALQKELISEAVRIQHQIDLQARVDRTTGTTAPAPGGAPGGGMVAPMEPGGGMGEMGPAEAGPGMDYAGQHSASDLRASTTTGYSKVALAEAVNNLRFIKAGSGWIYADLRSLHKEFPYPYIATNDEPPAKLWAAMVSLWIQGDVVYAIQKTIQDEFDRRKLPKGLQTVLTSPIKKIVYTQVGGKFSKKETGFTVSSGPSMGGMGEIGPMEDVPGGEEVPGGEGMAMGKTKRPDSLTGEMTNAAYDVVHYRVTLLMPTRFIPQVQKNLLSRNYHTILSQQVATTVKVDDSAGRGTTVTVPGMGDEKRKAMSMGGNTRANELVDKMYYYGTEPLRLVTFDCEVKLLTGWTRGEWNGKKWTRPPLAPLEVLRTLQRDNPAALRPIDRKRLDRQVGAEPRRR